MASKLSVIIRDTATNKQNQKALFFWLIILVTSLAIQAYGFGFNYILFRNFIENSALLIMLLCFSLLFNKSWKNFIQYFGYVVFWFNCLFESLYYYLFKANISASSIFILLETNLAEAKEFVEFYYNPFILFVVIVFVLQLILFFKNRPVFSIPKRFFIQKIYYVLSILIILALMIYKDFQRYNFLYLSVDAVFEYIEEQEKMSQFKIDRPIADIAGFRIERQVDTATYVLIVGESTTRYRMSLYGYSRKTTPFLDSLKPNLWKYDDVISSHAFTIGALRDALVINGLTSKDDFSIIQLMNQAGFKTYWISNQRPIGEYESLVTKIAMSSDVYITKNTALDGSITPKDEILIPEFRKILNEDVPKKFIVLHPLGTHMGYNDRYPSEFEKFKGNSPSKFNHSVAQERSNAYDNAILYHDFFLEQIHKEMSKIEHPAYYLYFSDHGEEVYESIDFSGHTEENPTKSMFDIPFFLWMNNEFKINFDHPYIKSNPYRLDHFLHTFSELNGLRFKDFDSTQSIFHLQDKSKRRKVGLGQYYDDLP
jgi:heptose-I-phosphate ethanolaminephosphotransferase